VPLFAGLCCTGAASAEELSKDQWQAIREMNTNKSDKAKGWTVSQSLLQACKDAGFGTSTRAQLKPMSSAASVLACFRNRSASASTPPCNLFDMADVTSPDKPIPSPEKPPHKKRAAMEQADDGDCTDIEVCPIRWHRSQTVASR
jgi:hypothetical protein